MRGETVKKVRNKSSFDKISNHFHEVTKNPCEFLSVRTAKGDNIKNFVKELYALCVQSDGAITISGVLPEIILEGMDEEQIWQQIELRNSYKWPQLVESASKMLGLTADTFKINFSQNFFNKFESENTEGTQFLNCPEKRSEEESDISDEEDLSKVPKKMKKTHKSSVDDDFFKLREMEDFLNAEDEKERKNLKERETLKSDAIDYFNDALSDDTEENANYKDFFDDELQDERQNRGEKISETELEVEYFPDSQNVNGNFEDKATENFIDDDLENEYSDIQPEYESSSSEEYLSDSEKHKSTYELRGERLKQSIEDYEEQVLSEKPWQLKGEITATGRPQNSLLQEVLKFDSVTRPAPLITEETTQRLEDIIKHRIKNKTWDDVERKVKVNQTVQEFRKQLILNQEKSKESLAQIYEKEYQKEVAKLNLNNENEEEPKLHKEIKDMMKSLFNKLDALSNFHYTPKAVAPDPKIVTNVSVINMEEVAPTAVSDAILLAPEEIKPHTKADIMGKSERSRTDKNRQRRKKKLKQRTLHKLQEEKDLEKQRAGVKLSEKEEKAKLLKKLIKNKNVKKVTTTSESGSLKSSKTFFNQLQELKTRVGFKERSISAISVKKLKF